MKEKRLKPIDWDKIKEQNLVMIKEMEFELPNNKVTHNIAGEDLK